MPLFQGPSLLIPEPLPFPRAPYADALETHARLLRRFEPELLLGVRRICGGEPAQDIVHGHVGLIVVRATGVTADVVPRARAAADTARFHGIARALHPTPEPLRLQVVVRARSVLSLHTFELEDPDSAAPRLRLVSRDDVVEPLKQDHRSEGAWTITRWVAHDREARYAWRPRPPAGKVDPDERDDAPPDPTDEPARSPARAKRTEVDEVEALLQRAKDDLVDWLATLTLAQLESLIAAAGFDPVAERALGPGLREEVVMALVRLDLASMDAEDAEEEEGVSGPDPELPGEG